jgi:hypothetical protein
VHNAFKVVIGADGKVTLTEYTALSHPNAADPNDAVTLNGLVQATVTVTDGDGDHVAASANIGSALSFLDDGPSISVSGTAAPSLTVDESNLSVNATSTLAHGVSDLFTGAYGADGAGSTTYALHVSASGADSGLIDTATGNHVFLFMEGGQVVGREGTSAATAQGSGPIDFTLSLNGSNQLVLDQQRALVQPDHNNPNDSVSLSAANLVTVTATITDGDGDSQTSAAVNLAQNIHFLDDGPTAVGETGQASSTVANINASYVLDFSGSISDAELDTMLNAVKAGAATMFNSTSGSVSIDVVIFASSAEHVGAFTSLEAFDKAIDALNPNLGGDRPSSIGSNTNYTAALTTEMANYHPQAGANNQLFFLSDGDPNEPSGTDGNHPIQTATATAWNTFINSNGVNVTAIGVGNDIDNGPLQAVDVDGHGAPIVVADFASLVDTLAQAIASQPVHGNVLTNDSFGADGGHIQSIVFNGVTYTWDSVHDTIHASTGGTDISGSELTNLATTQGGTFSFSFATANGHTAGDYTYVAPSHETAADQFTYTLVDNDGDTASATLSISLAAAGPANNTFTYAAGQSSIGTIGSDSHGNITGFAGFSVVAFDPTTETLNLAGTPKVAADTSGVNGVDSTLTVSNNHHISSHAISNGIITFDDNNTYSSALNLNSDAKIAAAVQYLQHNDLGAAGTTVAFVANGNTWVYEQVGDTPNPAQDLLIELSGVTLTNINTLIGNGHIAPVVLDLNHDGVQFVGTDAGTTFNYGSGEVSTAWAAPGDGVLALETAGGPIVSFTGFVQGATTDLQGLAAFDTNHDGKIDSGDSQWAHFGAIVNGQFESLTQLGVASINLTSDGHPYTAANGEVQVAGTGVFTYTNGTTGALADAAFTTQVKAALSNDKAAQGADSAYADGLVAATGVIAAAALDQHQPTDASAPAAHDAAAATPVAVAQANDAPPPAETPHTASVDTAPSGVTAPTATSDASHSGAADTGVQSHSVDGVNAGVQGSAPGHHSGAHDASTGSGHSGAPLAFLDTSSMPAIKAVDTHHSVLPAAGAPANHDHGAAATGSDHAKVAAVVADALQNGAQGGPDLNHLVDVLKGGQAPAGDAAAPQAPAHTGLAYLDLHTGASETVNAALQQHHHPMVAHDVVSGTHHA